MRCPLRACARPAELRYRLRRFDVAECGTCGLLFRHPLPGREERDALYRDAQYLASAYFDTSMDPRSFEVRMHRESLRAMARLRGGAGAVLDVGCGAATFLRIAREEGWKTQGVELSPPLAREARSRFRLDVTEGDFLDFRPEAGPYDAITLWDVLEHALDPEAVLAHARSLLAEAGILAILTIESRSLFNRLADVAFRLSGGRVTEPLELLYDARHNFYFSRESLDRLLATAGFEVTLRRSHGAHLGRWLSEPASLPVRAGGAVVDAASRLVGRRYRQLLLCRAVSAPKEAEQPRRG